MFPNAPSNTFRLQNRHFQNPYPDYSQFPILKPPDKYKLKEQVIVAAHLVMSRGKSEEMNGGVYVGPAGLTYLALHLFRNPRLLMPGERQRLTELAKAAFDNLLSHYKTLGKLDKTDHVELMTGMGGVNAVGAVFGKLTGDEKLYNKCLADYVKAAKTCLPLEFREGGSDELFVGRAGYLCGALWLQERLGGQPVPKEDLRAIWRAIVDSGKAYAAEKGSVCPLMYSYYETEYLGAAHGLSSILQILMSFPEFCKEYPADEAIIQEAVDYYMTLQDQWGNFPTAVDEIVPEIGLNRKNHYDLVHWCHGAPGAFFMFAKAFLHFKEDKYLDAAVRCSDAVWHLGLLVKGPGLCHGIAGNGYVFLILNRLCEGKDKRHFYRAIKFSEFISTEMFREHARVPDCPLSLFEGQAGTVCFLADLMFPDKAAFPLFDIYYNYQ